ncbi:MAG: hypothetical protein A2Z72_06715 [Omnitrophica bacterium RBG_13_46_9]|nr:MAG: hypothetical protein A2Z72_06715 [Omnitrophica bacterium RBG_13_46_9]
MKKYVVFILIIAFISISNLSHADTPIKKLGRGFANVLTCPLEIPKGICDANSESGPFAAMTFGLLKGLFDTGVRAVVGVYEVATFLIPIPRNYGPVLTDPEFFLEEGLF